jgi:hypothetical protein
LKHNISIALAIRQQLDWFYLSSGGDGEIVKPHQIGDSMYLFHSPKHHPFFQKFKVTIEAINKISTIIDKIDIYL